MALDKGMLAAPNFYFNVEVIHLMDRMFDFVMRTDSVRESAIRDHPDFEDGPLEDPTPPANRPRPRAKDGRPNERRLHIGELFKELGNAAAVARIIGISEPAVHRHLKIAGLR